MLAPPLDEKVELRRRIDRFPFLPSDPALLDENCYEAFNIQVHGLMTRLAAINARKVVLGISGGLDSTHAPIVAARAFDRLGFPPAMQGKGQCADEVLIYAQRFTACLTVRQSCRRPNEPQLLPSPPRVRRDRRDLDRARPRGVGSLSPARCRRR
jgi:hypothetical protein